MPDSVLIPAPVNAVMARAGRASSISAATAGSRSPGSSRLAGGSSTHASLLQDGLDHASAGHNQSCVRTASMVRCDLWSEPESPPNRHDVALTPHRRKASPPSTGDALAQPMNRGRPMMISQPAIMCLNATWQRLTGQFGSQGSLPPISRCRVDPRGTEPGRMSTSRRRDLLVASVVADGESLAAEARDQGTARPARPRCLDAAGRERATCPRRRTAGHGVEPGASLRRRRGRVRGSGQARPGCSISLAHPRSGSWSGRLTRPRSTPISQAGRERDAAVLRARVQSTFRPKPLRSRPQVILSP